MVLSMYRKQQIVQLYFKQRVSHLNIAKVLAAEGYWVPRQTVWATIKRYKNHGTLCHLPGSGRRFKLTPEVLALIEEQMQADDETTATHFMKMVNAAGYEVSKSTITRTRRILAWTFQRLQRLQLDRNDRTRRIITIPCARKWQQVWNRNPLPVTG